MTTGGATTQLDQSCDDALAWITRFRGDDAGEEEHRAFALWLAADVKHRQAMDLMLELWDDLGIVRHLPFEEPIEEPANPSRRRWLGGAAALAASVVMAALLWPGTQPPAPEILQTALGERREVSLPDGSRVVLNTDTRVNVHYRRAERALELVRGEAYFSVQHDPERPFTVASGDFQVTALGTAFNIYRQRDDSSDITVTEGVVRVSRRRGQGIQPPTLLQASEQLHASPDDGLARARGVDTRVHTAWQQGELVAEEMSVASVLNELSRYHDLRIVPGSHDIANLTVSGVFMLDHPDSVLKALERSLHLQAVQVNSRTLRLLKAGQ